MIFSSAFFFWWLKFNRYRNPEIHIFFHFSGSFNVLLICFLNFFFNIIRSIFSLQFYLIKSGEFRLFRFVTIICVRYFFDFFLFIWVIDLFYFWLFIWFIDLIVLFKFYTISPYSFFSSFSSFLASYFFLCSSYFYLAESRVLEALSFRFYNIFG